MKVLDKTVRFSAGLIMGLLVVDVVWQVLSRYVFKAPSPWTEELAEFLMIWLGFLGACVALQAKAHPKIDYVTNKLSRENQLIVRIFSYSVVLLFSISVLLYGGYQLVYNTFITNQTSPALMIKMGYVYLAIPVTGVIMVIYSISDIIVLIKNGGKN